MDDQTKLNFFNGNVSHHNQLNIVNTNNSDKLNIVYMNAQSMRNKLYDIEQLMISMRCEIHILVITETWLKVNEEKFFNFLGYNSFFCSRTLGYGGTAIFVKSCIPATAIYSNDSSLCNLLIVKLIKHNLNLVSVYRSPSNYFPTFIELIELIFQKYSQCIFVGDFNINLLNISDKETLKYNEIINTNGYLILNKISPDFITRRSMTIGTIIDHIFTDILSIQYEIIMSDTSLSDHKLMLIRMNKPPILNTNNQLFNVIDYSNILNDNLWLEIRNSRTMENMVLYLQKLRQKNSKYILPKLKNTVHKSWMNNEILALIRKREYFFKLKKKSPENSYVNNKYNYYRQLIVKKIKSVKKAINSKIISELIDRPKDLWKHLNLLIFNKYSEENSISLNINDSIVNDSCLIAEHFNNYFINAPTEVTKHIPPINISNFSDLNYRISHPLDLYEANPEEIHCLINQLKSSVATGTDEIPAKLLKFISFYLTDLLAMFLNDMFRTGIFPTSLKCTKVTPILKSGNSLDPNNYRPISVISALAKVAERAILNRFSEFLESNNILTNKQFGFCKSSNTTAACVSLTNFISSNLDKKHFVSGIFLDIRKAFDTVDHEILIVKLQKLGLTGPQLELFKSYLVNRPQKVVISNHSSSEKIVILGVPQGSILGPTLFKFFINDLSFVELNGMLQLYADDAVILYTSTSLQDLYTQMQADLDSLLVWFNKNRLVLNHDKTKYMVFGNREALSNDVLKYNNFPINQVSTFTYLGLIIDSKLKWFDHIDKIKSSIVPYIFAIKRVKYLLPKESLLLIYNAYILPYLNYVSPIWSGCAKYKIDELVVLQKKAIKYILNVPILFPSQSLFLQFTSFEIMLKRDLLVLVHQIINNNIKHNFNLIKTADSHPHYTRRRSHYHIDYFATNMSSNNVLYRGLTTYNNLPSELKLIKKVKEFKYKLTNFLKS